MSESDRMRVGDAEREEVAARLRRALDEGRLNVHEYDERLRAAYAAVVRRELDVLISDFPAVDGAGSGADVPSGVERSGTGPRRSRVVRRQSREWRSWLKLAVLLIGIWAVTSLISGHLLVFWPIFPLGIWAAMNVASMLFAGRGDDAGSECGRRRGE